MQCILVKSDEFENLYSLLYDFEAYWNKTKEIVSRMKDE